MGKLLGGTTIGGYPAVHTGMKQINLTGNISIINPIDEVFIQIQAFNNPASIIKLYSTEDGGGIVSSGGFSLSTDDTINLTSSASTINLYSAGILRLSGTTVAVSGDLTWNNGADSLNALKASIGNSAGALIASTNTMLGM